MKNRNFNSEVVSRSWEEIRKKLIENMRHNETQKKQKNQSRGYVCE
jgi:hypothetical protein